MSFEINTPNILMACLWHDTPMEFNSQLGFSPIQSASVLLIFNTNPAYCPEILPMVKNYLVDSTSATSPVTSPAYRSSDTTPIGNSNPFI